jgi:membrane-bound lytic murein transglycosylase B
MHQKNFQKIILLLLTSRSNKMKVILILFSVLIIAFNPSGATFSQHKHSYKKNRRVLEKLPSWVIKKEFIVNPKLEPRNDLIKSLIDKLEAYEGIGSQVTKAEFLRLLDRRESRIVYKDKLIKYATPKSQYIQKEEHNNYINYLLKEEKIREGVIFLNKYSDILKKAERKYGVYKQDLVSILMWESHLGKYTGNNRVFNIFMAQILFIDSAQKFALKKIIKKEGYDPFTDSSYGALEQKRITHRKIYAVDGLACLLRYCKEKKIDPLDQYGSWGGAIGYVQFMPFNLVYAVDADSDGVINLKGWPDAIYSAANYLKIKGNYSKDDKGRRDAIFQYNHSDEYVNGVIRYSDEIYKRSLQ